MPPCDVVGLGLNATDTVLVVPRFPAPAGKQLFAEEFLSPGGQVATAMVACAGLGLRVKYIGTVGDDHRGRIQMDSLRGLGIDLSDVQLRPGCPNQSAYIVVDRSTGERTVFWRRPECLRLQPEEIHAGMIAGARLLHIDGHDTEAVERAAAIAGECGIPVTMDIDTVYPGLDKVLPLVGYMIAGAEFPRAWTGEPDPFRALERIQQRYGMKVAAMTLGSHGALARASGRFHYSPAFVVDCVDTTGAGDVFHGAFCYSVLQDMDIGESLEFANAMAALNCTAYGARGRIGTRQDALSLMSTARRRTHQEYAERARGGPR